MLDDKIMTIINEYFDGELTPEKEGYLFSTLSGNKEAREYFKKMNKLKTHIASSAEEFPESLDEKIMTEIKRSSHSLPGIFKSKNIFSYLGYALLIFAMVGGYILFGKYNFQQEQLTAAREAIGKQKELIELITSGEQNEVTVKANLENKIIVKANL